MKQVIVFIGPNGAGKSTLARKILNVQQLTEHIDPDWYGLQRFGLNRETQNKELS